MQNDAPRLHQLCFMAKMASRPKTVEVWYRGIPYLLDLITCRMALVQRQVDGVLDSMESLASAVGVSRSTASRFFSGKPTSLAVTLRILEALHLKFQDAARPQTEEDKGAAGSATAPPRAPSGWSDGAAAKPPRGTR